MKLLAASAFRTKHAVAALLALSLAGPTITGCRPASPPQVADETTAQLEVVAVGDSEFGAVVHRLLREGKTTPQRSGLLAGAVRRQLKHAQQHFANGDAGRGTDAVVGALYLIRIGELHRDTIDAEEAKPLQGAIKHFSARGDEGRVLALMTLRKGVLPAASPAIAQQEKRRAVVEAWARATRTGGDITRLAADRRRTVARSLLEPSDAALQRAATAVNAWIERAIRYSLDAQQTKKLPPRAERSEALRALEGGAATMASLFLRHGRAKDAVAMLKSSAARTIAQPLLFQQLRAVAEQDDAEHWRELTRSYAMAKANIRGKQDLAGLQNVDARLLDAALWGIALEAYRRDPSSLAVGHILAQRLVALEMAEVAPLVLADALGSKPSVAALGATLTTVHKALALELGAPPNTARRIYANAGPLLTLADGAPYGNQLGPVTASIRRTMASIELHHGQLAPAKQLLNKALQQAPTAWGYTMLGLLERQAGNKALALRDATRAIALATESSMVLDAVDAKLLSFEVLRDHGDKEKAGAMLGEALVQVLRFRKGAANARAHVRAERQLARILDGYG
ncbi:MAG TPA: hypothetical protein ENK23_09115, partial [Sorangium sp.]|nr:hypothetical protein [Sorangium sp.]